MRAAARSVSLAVCMLAVCGIGCRKKVTEAHFRLENGLRVDLISTPRGGRAAVAVLFDIGADHDPPGRSGMARLVEHLFATAGLAGKPARTIDEVAGRIGHDFHTRTGADYTLYAIEAPAGRLMAEIDDAALRMSRLTVMESDLTRERKRLLGEVAITQERDAVSAAMNRAAEAVRPSRGGGLRGGIASEIEAMTLDEVEGFRLAHYGALTARLIVAGRFDIEEATKRIRVVFAGVPGGKPAQARAPSGSSVTGTLVMGDAPRAMALAVPPPDLKDPLYPAFLVLALRLAPGGAPRSWSADFAPLSRPDMLFVTSPIPAGQQPEAAAAAMRAEVTAVVKAPFAGDEANRAIEWYGDLLGLTPLSPEACAVEPFATAFAAGRRAQLGVDGAAMAQAARAVTQDQVSAAAQRFDTTHSAAVIAGGKL
jgi:Insulinase (Peptidase family M16)/Peptidase M16 inactive domain